MPHPIDPNNHVQYEVGEPFFQNMAGQNKTSIEFNRERGKIRREEKEFIPGESRKTPQPKSEVSFLEALFEIGEYLLSGMTVHIVVRHNTESLRKMREEDERISSLSDDFLPLPDIEEGDFIGDEGMDLDNV
jgi:hypothetical protein